MTHVAAAAAALQIILDWGAVAVMMQLLRFHGFIAPQADPQHIAAQQHSSEPWQDTPAHAQTDPAETSSSSSSSSGGARRYDSSKYTRTSGPFKAAKRPSPRATAAAAGGSGAHKSVGPELVLEQAAGLACMLCHNADNHFQLVNQGLVPLLVALLQQGEPIT
jgi:hypothetical protein